MLERFGTTRHDVAGFFCLGRIRMRATVRQPFGENQWKAAYENQQLNKDMTDDRATVDQP